MAEPIHLPAAAMARLHALAGRWTFSQDSPSAEGSALFRLGPGGLSLLTEEICRRTDGTLSSHGILTWDSRTERYIWCLTDSATPGVVLLTGSWADGIVLEGQDDRLAETVDRRVRFFDFTRSTCSASLETRLRGSAPEVTARLYSRRTAPRL